MQDPVSMKAWAATHLPMECSCQECYVRRLSTTVVCGQQVATRFPIFGNQNLIVRTVWENITEQLILAFDVKIL